MEYIRISPTLLDAFAWFDCAEDFERSREEWMDKLLRKKTPPSAAMQKGITFEEDVVACNQYEPDEGKKLKVTEERYNDCVIECHDLLYRSEEHCQVHVERVLDGKYLIHGYIDFLMPLVIVDLKTTGSYDIGKYLRKNQHHFYLYCMEPLQYAKFCYVVCDFKQVHYETYNLQRNTTDILRERIATLMDHFGRDEEARQAFFDVYQKS